MRNLPIIFALLFLLSSCDVKVTDFQDIEINEFETLVENQNLAKALAYYDPSYIAAHIPSLTEEIASGLKLGSFIRSSDGRPSYRITYRLDNPNVAASHGQLRQEFEKFIPELAKGHVHSMPKLEELQPIALSWVRSLVAGDSELYEKLHSKLQQLISDEDFHKLQAVLVEEGLDSFTYVMGQYYEEHLGFPTSFAIYFTANSTTANDPLINVNLSSVDGVW